MQSARVGSSQTSGGGPGIFSGGVDVKIQLDEHGYYTNLDLVSGKIILSVPAPTAISSIVVKLEGESKTKLIAPPRMGYRERPTPVGEDHLLLYKTLQVWPEQGNTAAGQQQVLPGIYQFPFSIKIPFNNACIENAPHSKGIHGFSGLVIETRRPAESHVKATLPPSFFIGDMADIIYYVKVTVNRPSLFKENPRAWTKINFVPIESPRPAGNGEAYARRRHEFSQVIPVGSEKKSGGLMDMFSRKSSTLAPPTYDASTSDPNTPSPTSPAFPSSPIDAQGPLRLGVDARLPNPSILVCGGKVPLRIIITQYSARNPAFTLKLQSLHIQLVAYTRIKAHEYQKVEAASLVIFTQSRMDYVIGDSHDPEGKEIEIPTAFWDEKQLPNTVSPSFVACNISRRYELHVNVDLSYGTGGKAKVRNQIWRWYCKALTRPSTNSRNPGSNLLLPVTPPNPSLLRHNPTTRPNSAHEHRSIK